MITQKDFSTRPLITIVDIESKFGTTVNGERLVGKVPTNLVEGDEIIFGAQNLRMRLQALSLLHCLMIHVD